MAPPEVRLALVSQVDELSTADLTRVARAIQMQIERDFAPLWGVRATITPFQSVSDVPTDHWPVVVQARMETEGTLGYHAERNGLPYALVQYREGWSLTASHQCLDMLGDPYGNRLISTQSPKPDQGRVRVLVQVCDPCEAPEFAYEIDGVVVSDFVLPAYYGGDGDRFDFRGAITKPLEVLTGGYISWHDPESNHWWQLTNFDGTPTFRDLGQADADVEEEDETDAVEAAPEAAPSRTGWLPGAANDQVAAVDQLGFRDYVTAFADLIASRHTQPPVTIGIFGSWGVGKSFLLRHIGDELRRRAADPAPAAPRIHLVELNAWAYSASDAVWPSLVRKVMACGEGEIAWRFPGRFLRKLWSNLGWELHQERGKLLAALFTATALLTFSLWRLDFNVSVLATVAVGLGATGVLKLVADTLANPLTKWATTVLKGSEYGDDLDYMRRIQRDLESLSGRLEEEHGRMVIMIDDLDRCEPEKMVEVLQAINLLLSFESYIVCLGIDARVVTSAIERHYAGMLEEAHASGYEYLDKIVQIPFRIPRPSTQDVQSFLELQLRGAENGNAPTIPSVPAPAPGVDGAAQTEQAEQTAAPAALVQGPKPVAVPAQAEDQAPFTEDEINAFDALAEFLEPNPRHLKRIVNVYRLVRSLATIRQERFVLDDPAGTIRLLALAAQWPFTLSAMFDRLDDLVEQEALGKTWPRGDPLRHLYTKVKPALDIERQSKLDQELDDLDRLLTEARGQLSWKALVSLRRYVVNFNPAVEEELRAAQMAAEVAARAARRTQRRTTRRTAAPAP